LHRLSTTSYNFINILLILSAGLIGPVSYFDAYSPHRVNNGFHITILQDTGQQTRLARILSSMQSQNRQSDSFVQQQPVVSRQASLPDFSKTLQLALTTYTLSRETCCVYAIPCLVCQLHEYTVLHESAYRPPPDEPPRSSALHRSQVFA
jgi:hypothetical protein